MLAQNIVYGVEIYLWIGAATTVLFILFGLERVEPNSKGSYAFRALLIPGLIGLWPLVLVRWFILEKERRGVK